MLKSKLNIKNNIKAQVTLFIILAIIIVGVVILFVIFRGNIFSAQIPRDLEPVYSYYLSCIKDETSKGALLLGEGGGYINDIEFSPGSEYMPFSSHLGFMGNAIPYWYYISGNGIEREQVPSKAKIESELNGFLKEQLQFCDFSEFEKRGFEINFSNAEVRSSIRDNLVLVNVKQNINIKFGDEKWTGSIHSVNVNSNIGKFYDLASKIYKNEKETMFLENYGVDILRLYAPVDGSEISCMPKIWKVNDIRENLTRALEANIPAIKIKGDYYTLRNKENKYFERDIGEKTDFSFNFMYSGYWPTKIEVWPAEDGLMRADPIGMQQGLGMLGFCYVPYHFVYDFAYPVLIQVYSGEEMFQFPIVVSIDKNKPRNSGNETGVVPDVVPELCQNKNTRISIYTYNVNLEPVEANIKFKCFDTTCDIGKSELKNNEAVLEENFPQCGNGFIMASADGYEIKKFLVSTISEGIANIVLDRKYKLELEVRKSGGDISGYSVVMFTKDNKANTFAYPQQKEIELTEGQYNIKTYIYSNASLNLKGSVSQKCIDIPKSGIAGVLGITEEKCFNMKIPDQTIDFGVSGGGVQNYYIAESELAGAKKIIIDAEDFGIPDSLEELQINYNNVEVSHLGVSFE